VGWAVGFDPGWKRDVGYGVPAVCDFPGCGEKIDRGLGYVCCGEVFGGEDGCGLFFCGKHPQRCERCQAGLPPFDPTPDTAEWMRHKLSDPSWGPWRQENPGEVERLRKAIAEAGGTSMITEIRRFQVVLILVRGLHPDLPSGPNYRCPLRPEGLSFEVTARDGFLDPGLVTVTGCNIRRDGSAGATAERWFMSRDRDDCPWAFEYVDRAVKEIAETEWPQLYYV
jgi:hypothetical protein